MVDKTLMEESFSILFEGPAFNAHVIPAAALAQSLSSLDSLIRGISETRYGKNAETEMKAKVGGRAGSFIIDLIIQSLNTDPLAATAESVTIAGAILGAIKIAK